MSTQAPILVALSGGVDSSVAVALLLEQGHRVIGAFMKNWSGCDWETEKRDAQRVAAHLGIDLHVLDFETEYRERVYAYMVREYAAGRTPNPDVLCNREMKFDLLLRVADELGCSHLATGHYARVEQHADGAILKKGIDEKKDQSYFLCRLGQAELRRSLFPVGELTKPEVRAKAAELGLVTAQKKDSQGLCFVGTIDLPTFLKERIAPVPGAIITTSGEVIGQHEGVFYYTIGQRHGLGVGGGEPWYVVERRLETNELVVAHEGDAALYTQEIQLMDVHWVRGVEPTLPFAGAVHLRYRQSDQACTLDAEGVLRCEVPQWAVAPGQFAVLYQGEELVGSGVIA